MCLPSPSAPAMPPAVDPNAERLAAEARAAQDANTEIASTRRRRAQQSVMATGAAGVDIAAPTTSTLAYGKQTLGG
jgi:hypothetical protein